MSRARMQVLFSGRVQGVGFRYTVKRLTTGYEVTGTIRNLADGRVELISEGDRGELDDFLVGIMESGLGRNIRDQQVTWDNPQGQFKGFEIVG